MTSRSRSPTCTRARTAATRTSTSTTREPGAGQAGRKYFGVAGTTDIWDWAARTKSRYHALQVAMNRPFRNGLLLKGAYTLSRAENETDEDGWATLTWHHPELRDKNFALAGYDRTHVFQLGFVYELPFARNSNSFLGQIVKNWQINGIGAAYSGTPFSINGTNPAAQLPRLRRRHDQRGRQPQADRHGRLATEPWYDRSALLAADRRQRRRLRQQRAQPVPHARRVERGPRPVPLVPGRAASVPRSASRRPTCSTTRTGPGRTPPSPTRRS